MAGGYVPYTYPVRFFLRDPEGLHAVSYLLDGIVTEEWIPDKTAVSRG
jgi:hypothetical protein